MDGSVVLGGLLWLLGAVCVAIQVRWAANDRRRELEAAAARAADGGQEADDGPRPGPDPWDRLPIQKRI